VDGIWRWVTGPEANDQSFYLEGQPTWNGTCTGLYCNWFDGRPAYNITEPNNLQRNISGDVYGEDYLTIIASLLGNYTWNDYNSFYDGIGAEINGYFLEFGGLSEPVLPIISSDISTANIKLSFSGENKPDHSLITRTTSAATISFIFEQLTELDQSGTPVKSFSFDQATFLSQHAGNQTGPIQEFRFLSLLGFGGTPVRPGHITLHFELFDDPTSIPYAGLTIPIGPSTVKWEMEIFDWDMQPGHSLELNISIASSLPILSALENSTFDPVNKMVTIVLETTETKIVIMLPTVVVADGMAKDMNPIPILLFDTNRLRFVFPYFNESIVYDPNVSVLVETRGDESGDDVALIVGLTVGLAGGAIVLVTLVLAGIALALLYHKYFGSRTHPSLVNFSGEEVASDL